MYRNNKCKIIILCISISYSKYLRIARWCSKIANKLVWKIIWQKAIFIPIHLPINVTICNKTIADNKISLKSCIAINGLSSWFEKSYLLQKIIAVPASLAINARIYTGNNCNELFRVYRRADKNLNKQSSSINYWQRCAILGN